MGSNGHRKYRHIRTQNLLFRIYRKPHVLWLHIFILSHVPYPQKNANKTRARRLNCVSETKKIPSNT